MLTRPANIFRSLVKGLGDRRNNRDFTMMSISVKCGARNLMSGSQVIVNYYYSDIVITVIDITLDTFL